MKRKGFTLIELLIVVAVIAVITIIVVWVINPTKMLTKARDTQRFSDVTSIATAINLYLADQKDFSGLIGPYLSTVVKDDKIRTKNDGTGWLPINFTAISSGKPLDALPVDPTNNKTYLYTLGVDVASKTYEVNCVFENAENNSQMSTDGGNNPNVFEIGTNLTILP